MRYITVFCRQIPRTRNDRQTALRASGDRNRCLRLFHCNLIITYLQSNCNRLFLFFVVYELLICLKNLLTQSNKTNLLMKFLFCSMKLFIENLHRFVCRYGMSPEDRGHLQVPVSPRERSIQKQNSPARF